MNFAKMSVLFLVMPTACITVPKIEGDMEAKTEKLYAAGKDDKPLKSPFTAGILNVIPGLGQMYAGDPGDGIRFSFMKRRVLSFL